jgi:hypothetical protein
MHLKKFFEYESEHYGRALKIADLLPALGMFHGARNAVWGISVCVTRMCLPIPSYVSFGRE